MNVPMRGTEHHNLRHPSPATDPYHHEDERVQGGGGVYFRGAAAAAALPSKGDADDNEEEALLTFHPVDEPDLQVVVSNIFSASGLANKDIGGAEDEDGNNEEEEANRTMKKRKRSEDVSHVPIYISDEEGDYDDQHDEGGDNDNDDEEEEGSSSSSSASASDRDLFHRLVAQGAIKVAAAEAASAGNKAPLFGLPALETDTETGGILASSAPVCGATTGGDSSEACASTGPAPSESEGQLDGAKSADEGRPLDDLCDNDDQKGVESVEYDYEDDDDYEARKRREEENMDEEQLRKKRRVEEEERVARNNLWRQSIKRSMFLEPPGSILSKRATL